MTTLELNWDRNDQLADLFAPEFALAETMDLDRPDHAPTIREDNSALLRRLREMEDKVAHERHAKASAPRRAVQLQAIPQPTEPPTQQQTTVGPGLALFIISSSACAGALAGIAAFFI